MKVVRIKLISICWLFLVFFSCTDIHNNSGKTSREKNKYDSVEGSTSGNSSPFISYSNKSVIGETVYIPVYSHIYQRNKQRTFNLTATLSIRNTDLQSYITISKVYYYDSHGNIIQKYLDSPRHVGPLSSISYVVEEEDLRGGVGANFLVLWEAQKTISKPIIEAVMISTSQQQGISFVSEGKVLHTLDTTN